MLLREYVEDHWLASVRGRVKASTFQSYESTWSRHLRVELGGQRLQGLATPQIDKLYRDLGQERVVKVTKDDGTVVKEKRKALKAKTIRNVHLVLTKALSDAVDAGLLSANPAQRAKPPKVIKLPADEIKAWNKHELNSFLRATADDPWHILLRLSAATGMRRAEVLGLRWRDINFEASTLTVRQTLLSIGYQTTFDTPKNHKPRTIDLDLVTINLLRLHRIDQNNNKHDAGDDYLDSDLVFVRDDGSLLHPDTYTQAFDRLVAQQEGLTRICLKDLRHTHATLLLQEGTSVKVVSERLGHSDPGFTLRVYAHVLPSMQAEAALQFASLIDTEPQAEAS